MARPDWQDEARQHLHEMGEAFSDALALAKADSLQRTEDETPLPSDQP